MRLFQTDRLDGGLSGTFGAVETANDLLGALQNSGRPLHYHRVHRSRRRDTNGIRRAVLAPALCALVIALPLKTAGAVFSIQHGSENGHNLRGVAAQKS